MVSILSLSNFTQIYNYRTGIIDKTPMIVAQTVWEAVLHTLGTGSIT